MIRNMERLQDRNYIRSFVWCWKASVKAEEKVKLAKVITLREIKPLNDKVLHLLIFPSRG